MPFNQPYFSQVVGGGDCDFPGFPKKNIRVKSSGSGLKNSNIPKAKILVRRLRDGDCVIVAQHGPHAIAF